MRRARQVPPTDREQQESQRERSVERDQPAPRSERRLPVLGEEGPPVELHPVRVGLYPQPSLVVQVGEDEADDEVVQSGRDVGHRAPARSLGFAGLGGHEQHGVGLDPDLQALPDAGICVEREGGTTAIGQEGSRLDGRSGPIGSSLALPVPRVGGSPPAVRLRAAPFLTVVPAPAAVHPHLVIQSIGGDDKHRICPRSRRVAAQRKGLRAEGGGSEVRKEGELEGEVSRDICRSASVLGGGARNAR